MSKRVLVEWNPDFDGFSQYVPPREVWVPDDVPNDQFDEWLTGTYECNVKSFEIYENDKN